MKILQISPQIPWPLDSGGRIGIYGILKYLAKRGNDIYFISYLNNFDQNLVDPILQEFCHSHILNISTENRIIPAIINLFSNVPYNISKFKTKELEEFLIDFFKKYEVDVVHIDHLHLGWTVDVIKSIKDVPVILREHNLELKIMQRFSEQQTNIFLKFYSYLQYKKFIRYEPALAEKFDKCIMVSEEDERLLKKMNPKVKTATIPVGVGKELLNINKSNIIPFSLFHIGSMSWLPNKDGLNWFLQEVFPSVIESFPKTTLYLYGSGTDKLNVPLSLTKNIVKIGYVKDIWEATNDKQLAIVPLRIGSGIRVKIIEMLATGQNIISTSIGKEGISITDGEEILIADTSEEFIDKIIKYFNNGYDSEKISIKAKQRVAEYYTWEKIAESFELEYKKLL